MHKTTSLLGFTNLGNNWQSQSSKFIKRSALMSSVDTASLLILKICYNFLSFGKRIAKASCLVLEICVQGSFIVPERAWRERGTFGPIPRLSRCNRTLGNRDSWSPYSYSRPM